MGLFRYENFRSGHTFPVFVTICNDTRRVTVLGRVRWQVHYQEVTLFVMDNPYREF